MTEASQRGGVAILFALLLVMLVGAAGFAVDVSFWMWQRTRLHKIADAAALSCVVNSSVCLTGTRDPNTQKFITDVSEPGVTVKTINPVECPDRNAQTRCVEAVASTVAPTFFAGLFGLAEQRIEARSTAGRMGATPGCLFALTAIRKLNGNPSVQGTECDNHLGAVDKVTGAPRLSARTNFLYSSENPSADCPPGPCTPTGVAGPGALTDPMPIPPPEFLTSPAVAMPSTCKKGSPCILSPGYYAGGIDCNNQDDCRLEPGSYFLDGPFLGPKNGSLTGDGVFIYLRGTGSKGTIDIQAGPTIRLTNAGGTTGACPGVNAQLLFYSRSAASGGQRISLGGGPDSLLRGNVSLPGYAADWSGGSNLTLQGSLVVDSFSGSGNSTLAIDPSVLSCRFSGPGGGRALLVQ